MTARLPDHLDLIASAPNGIKKLRGLILELAVRGKIVSVDKQRSKMTTLGEVGKWAVGSGFPTVEQGKAGLEILFAKVSDMNLPANTKFIVATNHTISRDTAKRLRVNVHPAGTVVFPKIGGAIATNKRRILIQDTAIDNNCLGITPKTGVDSEWLYVLLSSINLTKYQAGTSVPALAQGVLAEIPVLLPPLAEQHRIVAKVDELMALCDELEQKVGAGGTAYAKLVETLLGTLTQSTDAADLAANWQRLAEHFDNLFTTEASIDTLKQAILQLAVMGKLVPQDPNDEPASELLKRIAKKRARLEAEGICKRPMAITPIPEEELPFTAPSEWTWKRLDDLLAISGGITLGRKLGDRKVVSRPYLRVANVQRGSLLLERMKSIEVGANEVEKYRLQSGDLLITEGGDWDKVGRTAIWRDEIQDCLHQNHVFRARPLSAEWSSRWTEMYLNAAPARAYFAASSKQTTNLASINMTQLKSCPFPLPPLAEQHRIVAKVDELMTLCARLKADLAESRTRQTRLSATLIESALQAA